MTNKAYIVANEQQEHNILKKFEQEGLRWQAGEKPTEWKPVKEGTFCSLPYALVISSYVSWLSLSQLTDEEIVFDGRKESKMSEKYVVSQEFIDDLKKWKQQGNTEACFVGWYDISVLPDDVKRWWTYPEINNFETNNRLIAIIRWVNGEDVFEVEKPKKWVVRSKDSNDVGEHRYLRVTYTFSINHAEAVSDVYATKFDTKEEAESWANSHQEVVEVVDV